MSFYHNDCQKFMINPNLVKNKFKTRNVFFNNFVSL